MDKGIREFLDRATQKRLYEENRKRKEIQFILYQLPDEEGRVQAVISINSDFDKEIRGLFTDN